jgi:hypothetical protein
VVAEGYGGLEHRNSTALICNRRDLPVCGEAKVSEGYTTLRGLISHEYFHTWNVKRLRPVEFARYDYTQENYTRLHHNIVSGKKPSRYVIVTAVNYGFADRCTGFISAFYYALLTNRAIISIPYAPHPHLEDYLDSPRFLLNWSDPHTINYDILKTIQPEFVSPPLQVSVVSGFVSASLDFENASTLSVNTIWTSKDSMSLYPEAVFKKETTCTKSSLLAY